MPDAPVKLALLVLPLLLTGCGGGSHPSSAAVKTAYLIKAEDICTKAIAAQKALPLPTGVADLSTYVTAIVQVADTSTMALAALTAPAPDRAALDKHMLDPLKTQLAKARQYAVDVKKASDTKDQMALATLFGNPPTKPLADLTWMRSYGFRQCVDVADTSN